MFNAKISIGLLAVATFLLFGGEARAIQITVTSTIQAAVDQANPGDTIVVPAGTYRENVIVNKSGITIRGSRNAILDGDGSAGNHGIRVASATPGGRLNGFNLEGMTIRNYQRNGVFLIRVDNYSVIGGVYENNELYGIYPVRSNNGVVEHNQTSGSEDAGIYIGQSDSVVIRRNICFDNTTGIEIENSTHVEASSNLLRNNSLGIIVFVFPGRTLKVTEDVVVARNTVVNNNRPNLITDPDDIHSLVPDGVGVLVLGGDRVHVQGNRALNNDSVGIAVARLPAELADLDPLIDPFVDASSVLNNVVLHNGTNPDPRIAPLPGADLLWDLTGTGNHWEGNIFQTSFPDVFP